MFIRADDQIFIVAFFKQTNTSLWTVVCQWEVSQHPPLIILASFHSREAQLRESKMAADPNPQTQRDPLDWKQQSAATVSGCDSLNVCIEKWARQKKKNKPKKKTPACLQITGQKQKASLFWSSVAMAKSRSSNLVIVMFTNHFKLSSWLMCLWDGLRFLDVFVKPFQNHLKSQRTHSYFTVMFMCQGQCRTFPYEPQAIITTRLVCRQREKCCDAHDSCAISHCPR